MFFSHCGHLWIFNTTLYMYFSVYFMPEIPMSKCEIIIFYFKSEPFGTLNDTLSDDCSPFLLEVKQPL